ncbi:MAG: GntR family transcriptional regulator [Velocimicrobium sp.]
MEFDATQPIYMQIGDRIKEEIIRGKLQPGDKLKSVRENSLIFEVSNLTIHRMIQYLEREGVIYTKKGIGSFVNTSIDQEMQKKMIRTHVDEFICKMRKFGIDDLTILSFVREELEKEQGYEG